MPGSQNTVPILTDGASETDEIKRVFFSLTGFVNRLTTLLLVVLLFALVLLGACLFLYSRKPDVVTWVQNPEGRIMLTVNDKSFGDIQALAFGDKRDAPEVKIFAAKELARVFANVDPDTRPAALLRIVNWFRDDAAKTRDRFAKAIKDEGSNPSACVPALLEKTQGWQATFEFTEQPAPTIDNPNMIRINGIQNLRRTLVSSSVEKRLLQIEIEMAKEGLTEQNLMTGYVPTFFQCKVLQTTVVDNTAGNTSVSGGNNSPWSGSNSALGGQSNQPNSPNDQNANNRAVIEISIFRRQSETGFGRRSGPGHSG